MLEAVAPLETHPAKPKQCIAAKTKAERYCALSRKEFTFPLESCSSW